MNRRDALKNSAAVAGMLLAAGLLPRAALAAYNKAAFDAKTVADVIKALGASAPQESKDVSLTAPDIAENGAVVPIGAATTLANVKSLLVLVEKNPNTLVASFDVNEAVEPNFLTRAKLSIVGRVCRGDHHRWQGVVREEGSESNPGRLRRLNTRQGEQHGRSNANSRPSRW